VSLPHNAHETALSLSQAVAEARSNPQVEVDLAASKHFYDFEGDWAVVTAAYEDYFAKGVTEVTRLLGEPIYRGPWNAPDRSQWDSILPEFASAQELVVWQQDSKRLYCRYSWQDKEIPILIALGVEGCRETGIAYEGQFD
jgi:hypothetical protein